jgi:hypothetical protein
MNWQGGLDPGMGRSGMCDRCGAEPDADLTRYEASEAGDKVLAFELCPKCSYGLNTFLRAYVANRDLSLR